MTGTKTLVLAFAQKNYSSDSGTDVLKSGDIITITAEGYNDLMFKLVIDKTVLSPCTALWWKKAPTPRTKIGKN